MVSYHKFISGNQYLYPLRLHSVSTSSRISGQSGDKAETKWQQVSALSLLDKCSIRNNPNNMQVIEQRRIAAEIIVGGAGFHRNRTNIEQISNKHAPRTHQTRTKKRKKA
jgi:hypothetical protein